MPKVTFVPDHLTVEVPKGAKLPNIVDGSGASLPFGCRSGTCGTCRCIIAAGMENLNAMTDAEREMFDTFTYVGKDERLGCQLVIQGDVKIQF